jgi:hypothetical protein
MSDVMGNAKDSLDRAKETVTSTVNSSNLVNLSIVTYVSFTFLFFVLKFRFFPANNYYWILLFLLISCGWQMIQNMNISAAPDMCGAADFKMAFYATVMPWMLIFTVFVVLMLMSPGWLRVFSNTFGVFAAEAYGIQGLIQEVIKQPTTKDNNYEYMKMLEQIYSDRMSLVIELNLDDVEDIKDKDTGIYTFKFPALDQLEKMNLIEKMENAPNKEKLTQARRDLYNALLLKDNVGYFFWFLLMGIFCILVSTNTLLSSSCSPKMSRSYDSIFK